MKTTILFLALCAFVSTSLSMPLFGYDDNPDEFYIKLREAATYDKWLAAIDGVAAGTPDAVNKIKTVEMIANLFETDENIKNFFKTFGPALKAIVKVWKATVPKGAAPTDEELTDLAKKLSKAARDIPVDKLVLKIADSRSLMTKENIKILADLIASRPASEPGKTFMDQLKEKSKLLYCAGLEINDVIDTTDETSNKIKAECGSFDRDLQFGAIVMGYLFKENFENLRSEENAIERVKAFATFVNTVTNSASFDGYDSLYRGLSRNKNLEAFVDIIRETRLCYMDKFDPERKEAGKEIAEAFPSALQQLIFTDSVPPEEIIAGSRALTIYDLTTQHFSAWADITNDKGGNKFLNCLMPESDIKLYKSVILSDDVTVSEAKLNEIKAKSKRAHGVLFLLNSIVRAAHRRDGLSEKAEAFYKKVTTVPHIMTKMTVWFTLSEEVLNKKSELKQKHIREFDELTPEVKKELVKRFPYKALSVIAQGEL